MVMDSVARMSNAPGLPWPWELAEIWARSRSLKSKRAALMFTAPASPLPECRERACTKPRPRMVMVGASIVTVPALPVPQVVADTPSSALTSETLLGRRPATPSPVISTESVA